MAVQFILGRSGTGKTSFCIKAIVKALLAADVNQPLILLVPEQATYQAERAILNDKSVNGYSRKELDVVSFERLTRLLLRKAESNPDFREIVQPMIIHKILRDNSGKLKVFGPSATRPGLSLKMAGTVSELNRYANGPEDVDRLLKELQKDDSNKLAGLKFADVDLVLKEYLKFIGDRLVDPDIQLNCARRAVAQAGFIKGARLWVDGFAGFTAGELAVLAELLKTAADTQIALCLDPSSIDLQRPDKAGIDPAGLFNPIERTYAELVEIIKKCKLRLAEPIILDKPVRFSRCPELAHLERNIFKFEASKIPAGDNVRIVSAANARSEILFVTRQILRLIREKDYRYRDIAVIASDIDSYQHYIRACFDDYAIPFFIDKPRSLSRHPAIVLICSVLQTITGGFGRSDIFAYLKTDLVPIERSDVDLLENYCLAFGITGGDWTGGKDWHFSGPEGAGFDEQRINQIRSRVGGPLLELRDKLCPADNPERKVDAEEFTRVVFDLLEGLGVRERIAGWVEEAAASDDRSTVEEHRQFYDKFVGIFDELVEVFTGEPASCEDYLSILTCAFSQLKLAFIPPTLDQVLVGSIERSRHPDLKAVFLIGSTQKQFPSPVSYDSLLTERDRMAAESADFALAPATAQSLAQRQYLAYIGFTRAAQFLCVTYPLTDDSDRGTTRSQFVDNLQSLFDGLNEEPVAPEQIRAEKVYSKSELADLLCSSLGKETSLTQKSVNGQLAGLLDDICRDEQLAQTGSIVAYAVNYENRAQLDKTIIAKLFGERIKTSATRLSAFAACPYKHFARYILELKEKKEFKLKPLDVGSFYHRILDLLLKQLNSEKKNFATVKDEELLQLLKEQISKLVQTDAFLSNFDSRSRHNSFIIRSAGEALEDCILAIAQMVRAGSFKPSLSEVSFGAAGDTLGEYEITLSDNRQLFLDGVIDRLDIAGIGGEKTAVIFDYKRKGRSFNWSKFYYGLDMQLPIYMSAIRSGGDSQFKIKNVAGAFYVPIETKVEQAALDELPAKTRKFNYKAAGICDGDFSRQLDKNAFKDSTFYNFYVTKDGEPYGNYGNRGALKSPDFEKVLEFTERKICELGEAILSGKIAVNPYRLGTESPCGYCEYKALCRFDWQINEYNSLVTLGKGKVLEKTETKAQR